MLVGGSAVPRAGEVSVDGAILAFAAGLTLLTGVAFGTVPALRLAGVEPARSLRDGSRGGSSGRFVRARSALVAGQVALALVLLVGASVLAVSVYRLGHVELGLRTDDVLTFQLNLPAGRYDEAGRTGFHRDMAARLEALPQVRAAGAIHWVPASGSGYRWGTRPLTGPEAGTRESFIGANQRVVAGDYFDALGVPVLDGRVFDRRDGPESPAVVVIDRAAAERMFPGTSAVGQRVSAGGRDREVIGVVENVATDIEGTTAPHVYHLHAQFASRLWAMSYVVHTAVDPLAAVPAVREAVAARDPALVLHEPATLGDRLGQGRSHRAFAFALTATFAGLALTLALIGLYVVLAYVVGQRTREFGIRIALGAHGRQVAGRVLRRGLQVVAVGLAVGLVGAIGLARLLESLVFETEPTDPWILAGAAGTLLLVAGAATLFPAARAARISPRTALSQE